MKREAQAEAKMMSAVESQIHVVVEVKTWEGLTWRKVFVEDN